MSDLPYNGKPRFVVAADRRHQALELRKRGYQLRHIAEVLGVTHETVRRHLRAALEEIHTEDTETIEGLRVLENERLDDLLGQYQAMALAGDVKAAGIVIKIMERRARMNGLDAAQRHEVNVNGSILHELGTDIEEIERERQAWLTATSADGAALDYDVDAEAETVDADR